MVWISGGLSNFCYWEMTIIGSNQTDRLNERYLNWNVSFN